MLIFGWRTRSSRLGGGSFHCPVCNAPRTYAHLALRRWFTLFFVPLIPVKRVGEFVRCETCQVTLDPVVLQTRGIEQATFTAPGTPLPEPGSALPPPQA